MAVPPCCNPQGPAGAFRPQRTRSRLPDPRYPMLRPLALALGLLPAATFAQDAPAPALSVELNGAETVETACRLTFLVQNGLGTDLTQLALETVILTTDGIVERLTLFDFRDLPADRPRVRQFDLAGLTCDGIGKVLINATTACTGEGVDPAACTAALTLTSRVEGVDLLG